MEYKIWRIDYDVVYNGSAIAIISAGSEERARSLLEECVKKENIGREIHIKYKLLKDTGFPSLKEGIIFNSETEEPTDCAEEGLNSAPFTRD
ncbi:MAG: hypothetical protein AABX50_02390 [Nanoarchaeota archaeon]